MNHEQTEPPILPQEERRETIQISLRSGPFCSYNIHVPSGTGTKPVTPACWIWDTLNHLTPSTTCGPVPLSKDPFLINEGKIEKLNKIKTHEMRDIEGFSTTWASWLLLEGPGQLWGLLSRTYPCSWRTMNCPLIKILRCIHTCRSVAEEPPSRVHCQVKSPLVSFHLQRAVMAMEN